MSDRDLTPDEARAEVEAFMGEGWVVASITPPDYTDRHYMSAWIPCRRAGDFQVRVESPCCPTYRAAVSALKAAWRDAVRPWVAEAVHESGTHAARIAKTYDEAPERRAWDTAEAAILTDLHDPDDPDTLRVIARVLKEDK